MIFLTDTGMTEVARAECDLCGAWRLFPTPPDRRVVRDWHDVCPRRDSEHNPYLWHLQQVTPQCHHIDSPVDVTADGRPVFACIVCGREVVEEADGSFVDRGRS